MMGKSGLTTLHNHAERGMNMLERIRRATRGRARTVVGGKEGDCKVGCFRRGGLSRDEAPGITA